MKNKILFVSIILLIAFSLLTCVQASDDVSLELENQISASFGYEGEKVQEQSTMMKKARATTLTSGDYTYEIETSTNNEQTVTIKGYTGTAENITIPSNIEGKKVKEIGGGAFYQNSKIKSVVIPDSVTVISSGAFAECKNITTIIIGKNVENIGDYAFQETKISSIKLPATLNYISNTAFFKCMNLTDVQIDSANKNYSVSSAVIFNKDKSALWAYLPAKKITTYEVPNTVSVIMQNAFFNDNLQTIKISANVQTILTTSFCFNTPNLKSIEVDAKNENFASINGVLFNKNKKNLLYYPSGKTESSYNIPSGTEYIEMFSFYNSNNLKSIVIPSTVKQIGTGGFRYALGLETITIPASVKEFGAALFQDCPNLRKAIISANSEVLSYLTFNKCPNLEEVIINGNIKTIIKGAFYYCPKLTKVTLPNSLERINFEAFFCCDALENIVIPANVELIEERAFYDYNNYPTQIAKTKLDISKTKLKKQSDGSYAAYYDYSVKGTRDYEKAYEVLNLVNEERKKAGLKEVKMDGDLLESAMKRSAELVTLFDHERPNGLGCETAVTKSYYGFGENIAQYQTTSASVMNSWMNSQGHRENILTSRYDAIGIGCYKADNGRYYWTQMFTYGADIKTVTKPSNKNTTESYNVRLSILPFTDVKKSNWYYNTVKYVLHNKYITGVNSTTFKPNDKITRGQLVTILWRMSGSPKATNPKNFTDVKSGDYYYEAVRWAAGNKIVSGYDAGRFGPKDNITRAQLAVMLNNYAKFKKQKITNLKDISSFKDANGVASYAVDAVKWAIGNKIISGKENGTKIDPKGNASRAEAAAMIQNYCNYVK